MCGIVGIFPGDDGSLAIAIDTIGHRGRDARRLESVGPVSVGHVLHSLVGEVPQPLHGKGVLLYNGQIYNWRSLAKEEGISAKNDSEVLLHLLDNHPLVEVRSRIDGVYAFAYLRDEKIILERDLLGVRPLWYSTDGGFSFASEKKALLSIGLSARELHPRTTLEFDTSTGELHAGVRGFDFPKSQESLNDVLRFSVEKRIPEDRRLGVLFSGGVDSSLVALLARDAGADVTLYVAALDDPDKQEPHDLVAAREAAEALGLPLVEVRSTLDDVERLLPEICRRIEDSSVVKVGVALPLWLCAHRASKDGHRVLMSGLGAEEVFAGYQRHKQAVDIDKECVRGLRAMHERDLYRDDVVGMSHTLEIRLPFLDHAVIGAGLAIPGPDKIVDGVGKMPLRRAAIGLGLPEAIAMRPKRAAQYGSQFDAALDKIARRHGESKSGYLRSLYPVNARLCALLSGGKDSVYALYTMQRMNYEIACCATIVSDNPDSYMFHTPALNFASLQAGSMGLPLITVTTEGKKEEELSALREALLRAKGSYGVEGVVSGALFSDYQRSRIESVCEELGLRVYAPLWHIDQEQEVREILDAGFIFVLSKVAAEGLDRSWVGRPITHDDIDVLSSKLGLNVAGEGGEYESLVIDGPNFSRPISLVDPVVDCEEGSVEVCVLRAEGVFGERS